MPRFFAVDHLGSVGAVTDSTSTLLAGYAFDPWGRRTVTTGTDVTTFGYTGHRWDVSSGIALTMYRGYKPELGLWISEDPLGFVDGPEGAAYVSNNPLSAGDLLGLSARIRCEQIKGQGYWTDVGLKFVNARHCFLRSNVQVSTI